MTQASYSVYLSDPYGIRIGDASGFVKLQYTRVVNDVGILKLWLPANFDTNLISIPDGRIEVWRKLPGASSEYLDTETVWFIKAIQWDRSDDGEVSLLVEADTPLSILRERWYGGPTQSTYSPIAAAPADNQILSIARNHLTSAILPVNWADFTNDADATYAGYVISDYLSIIPNPSLGASLGAREYSWASLLPIMRDIAASSAQNGVYIAFDIVAPTPSTLEFRTYAQQRGVDHRFPSGINPVIVGGELGGAGQATMRKDYRKEVTYASAAGAGQGSGQIGSDAWDITRLYASPFGRRQTVISATNQNLSAVLHDIAEAAVFAGRPRWTYRGRLLSVPGSLYGVHWSWGDYITVQDFGQSFDARIEAVTVSVDKGQEKIDAWVKVD